MTTSRIRGLAATAAVGLIVLASVAAGTGAAHAVACSVPPAATDPADCTLVDTVVPPVVPVVPEPTATPSLTPTATPTAAPTTAPTQAPAPVVAPTRTATPTTTPTPTPTQAVVAPPAATPTATPTPTPTPTQTAETIVPASNDSARNATLLIVILVVGALLAAAVFGLVVVRRKMARDGTPDGDLSTAAHPAGEDAPVAGPAGLHELWPPTAASEAAPRPADATQALAAPGATGPMTQFLPADFGPETELMPAQPEGAVAPAESVETKRFTPAEEADRAFIDSLLANGTDEKPRR